MRRAGGGLCHARAGEHFFGGTCSHFGLLDPLFSQRQGLGQRSQIGFASGGFLQAGKLRFHILQFACKALEPLRFGSSGLLQGIAPGVHVRQGSLRFAKRFFAFGQTAFGISELFLGFVFGVLRRFHWRPAGRHPRPRAFPERLRRPRSAPFRAPDPFAIVHGGACNSATRCFARSSS